jgi:hypothetical protein
MRSIAMDGTDLFASEGGSLQEQLLRECLAMLRYALASGLAVPPLVVPTVDTALAAHGQSAPRGLPDGGAPADTARAPLAEAGSRSGGDLGGLVRAHAQLAALVAPASPRTLVLLARSADARGRWSVLGPVRLVRHMLLVAMLALLAFIVLAASPDVTRSSGDIYDSSGLNLLINEAFFLAAGAVGAAFAALFKAYPYVANSTYDPKYESSYWMQFVLGLIAGVLLPALIPLGESPDSSGLTKPLLALLGGFSATIVYRVLDRLVQTVESLVKGDARDVLAAQERAAQARAAERAAQERLDVAAVLARLQDRVGAGASPERLSQEVNRAINSLNPRVRLEPEADDARAAVPGASLAAGPGPNGQPAPEAHGYEVAAAPAPP